MAVKITLNVEQTWNEGYSIDSGEEKYVYRITKAINTTRVVVGQSLTKEEVNHWIDTEWTINITKSEY